MGVHGLWKLIDPSGRTVPLETLENKVLAVDVSIWLHQMVKGFQDAKGVSVPNAHLLGVYHRLCKLLYFRIKPVFVFDGGVPVLKKETIAKRSQFKAKKMSEADRVHRDLLNTLLKHSAISKVLSEKTKAAITPAAAASAAAAAVTAKPVVSSSSKKDDLYFLPPCELDSTVSSSSDEEPTTTTTEDDYASPVAHHKKNWDLHTIDTKSEQFKALPIEVRHEILTDLKETRKQSSWGRINELPTQSGDFSLYQMNRLLKRQAVQSALEDAEKEMGGNSLSLGELEQILKDQGVLTTNNPIGNRIASDENTRFLLIKDIKRAIEEEKAKMQRQEELKNPGRIIETSEESDADEENQKRVIEKDRIVSENGVEDTSEAEEDAKQRNKADLEFEDDLQRAIALSLQDEPSTSKVTSAVSSELHSEAEESVTGNSIIEKLSRDEQPSTSKVTSDISDLQQSEAEKEPVEANSARKRLEDEQPSTSKMTTVTSDSHHEARESVKTNSTEDPSLVGQPSTSRMTTSDLPCSKCEEPRARSQKRKLFHEDEQPSTSKAGSSNFETMSSSDEEPLSKKAKRKMQFSFLEGISQTDLFGSDDSSEEEETVIQEAAGKLKSAQSYMMEYSGLTPSEIAKIIAGKAKKPEMKKDVQKKEPETRTSRSENRAETVVNTQQKVESTTRDRSQIVSGLGPRAASDLEGCASNTVEQAPTITDDSTEEVPPDSTEKIEHNIAQHIETEKNEMLTEEKHETKIDTSPKEIVQEKLHLATSKERKLEISSSTMSAPEESVEIMSDSDSSNPDDLVEVDPGPVKSPKSAQCLMEVVIKPDESLEDDLFSDIFKNENPAEKSPELEDNSESKNPGSDGGIRDVSEKIEENPVQSSSPTKSFGLKEKLERYIAEKTSPVKLNSSQITQPTVRPMDEPKTVLSVEQMTEMASDLREQQMDLIREQSANDRLATNISTQMYQETQELLELFGVPYVIAPMEAEAQCAFLEQIRLTDGTITDDSDIWLFGGQTVYKNFFNDRKHVMEFRAENITHHFKLTRQQMILLALLVGSDYTIGLHGVGPVTALEILATFPPKSSSSILSTEFTLSHSELLSGLREFRSWLGKDKSQAPKRTWALKTKLKNVNVMESFPSAQVVQAYLEPKVETSEDKFSWSAPNILGLTEFARQKFGWTKVKTEEILKPVLRRMKDHKMQAKIRDYFKTYFKVDSGETEAKMSKRVKTALDKLGNPNLEDAEKEEEPKPKKTRARKRTSDKTEVEESSSNKSRRNSCEKELTKSNEKSANSRKRPGTSNNSEDGTEEKPATIKRSRGRPRMISSDKQKETTPEDEAIQKTSTQSEINDSSKQPRGKRKASAHDNNTVPKNKAQPAVGVVDEDLKVLEQVQQISRIKMQELEHELQVKLQEVEKQIEDSKKEEMMSRRKVNLHKKEVIPQKLREKSNLLRNKMKAIEVFRKSKLGQVKRKGRSRRALKEDAGLSESSSGGDD